MLENGYELKYLVLDRTGDVHYDREAHSEDILSSGLRGVNATRATDSKRGAKDLR